ncbi:MAG TPA: intradiol ring-cleavage dioxygenase [Gemmatimonadota bacterium]|nr:intradiol ring-cleavage dioxygenase [Gemmatimonadota bacterium]
MVHDDRMVGALLSRRAALLALGAGGFALLTGCGRRGNGAPVAAGGARGAGPACVVRPQQTEGPYFVDGALNRVDIRPDPASGRIPAGAPLELTLDVSRIDGEGCTPLPGAVVDLWQCDAAGVYSGVRDPAFDTSELAFLRGWQVTDGDGRARFTTIYPGWYPGRTVHVHFKVRSDPAADPGFEFTSQLYFDDDLTDRVFAAEPYAVRGPRNRRNENDGVFRRDGGSQLVLDVTETDAGYAAAFAIGLQTG